jgi:hypothetical protein
MERKIDAVEALEIGYQHGLSTVIKLVNKYCGFEVKDVAQLVAEINRRLS